MPCPYENPVHANTICPDTHIIVDDKVDAVPPVFPAQRGGVNSSAPISGTVIDLTVPSKSVVMPAIETPWSFNGEAGCKCKSIKANVAFVGIKNMGSTIVELPSESKAACQTPKVAIGSRK